MNDERVKRSNLMRGMDEWMKIEVLLVIDYFCQGFIIYLIYLCPYPCFEIVVGALHSFFHSNRLDSWECNRLWSNCTVPFP